MTRVAIWLALTVAVGPANWGCEMAGRAVTSSMNEETFKHSDEAGYPPGPPKVQPGLANLAAQEPR
jgi:hypothetical protein